MLSVPPEQMDEVGFFEFETKIRKNDIRYGRAFLKKAYRW
jgi:hypothetical protein